jgi:hypothetical protein
MAIVGGWVHHDHLVVDELQLSWQGGGGGGGKNIKIENLGKN